MRNLTLFVLTLFVLSSCGPAHQLRKAERLMQKAIANGAKVRVDTVFTDVFHPGEKTTVYLPGAVRDTTITVYQDKIRIEYRHHHDTVRVSVVCPPDTLKIPVVIHKSIICPDCPKDRFFKGVGYGAGGVLILLIILGLVRLIKP